MSAIMINRVRPICNLHDHGTAYLPVPAVKHRPIKAYSRMKGPGSSKSTNIKLKPNVEKPYAPKRGCARQECAPVECHLGSINYFGTVNRTILSEPFVGVVRVLR